MSPFESLIPDPSTLRRHTRFALGLILLTVIAGCAGTGPGPSVDAASADASDVVDAPVTSAIDDRTYRAFTLDNGLEVLVVSDPTTDKSAAALAVDVGSFDEDPERLGLAHFLEHMLFLGTEKYPDPNEYGEYIASRGGSRNAYTSLDHTNYFFSIAADELEGGLDRFAQFFVAPLFTAEFVDREKNAVNSEYQMQLRDDGWRTYMTQKRAINPEHPGSRFTIGSLETLADRPERSVRDDLLAFYADHYTADGMSLVILGREDVDTLATWAERMFSGVPSRDTVDETIDVPVFDPASLPSLMRIRPVKERRSLEISFELPSSDAIYRINPGAYLSSLIGHEGAGSLHAKLRELGWIDSLSAGSSRFGESATLLSINADLTEAGLANWPLVGEKIFAYIDVLRDGGVSRARYVEQSELADLAFRFQEKGDPFGYVRRLASNMLVYPTEDVIRGSMVMDRFDEDVIADFLDRLRPELAQVTLISPDVETDRVEPWFDVPYTVVPLPQDVVSRWRDARSDPALRLPAPNPFVPEDLELLADGPEIPRRIVAEPGIEVWHLQDTEFGTPRARVRADLRSVDAGTSPDALVHTQLYTRLVMDALNEYAYPARLAGLSFRLFPNGSGVSLTVGGFDDKLDDLLSRVATTLADLDIREDRFAHFKRELVKDLRNAREDRPYQQTIAELNRLLDNPAYALDVMIEAAERADQAALQAWADRTLASPELLMFVHGNVDAAAARDLSETLRSALDLEPTGALAPRRALVRLADGTLQRREVPVDHPDAALTLYVQGRDQSWEERARFGLLAHMMSAPYFNALRTEQQLGYVVTAAPWVRVNTPGVIFLVQSPVASPAQIESATMDFLGVFRDTLASLTPEQFEAERAGLLSSVLEADKNLGERSARLWGDLEAGIETFDAREQVAEAIRALDLATMQAFMDTFMEIAAQRRIAVWSRGAFPAEAAPTGADIADIARFKAELDRFSIAGSAGHTAAGGVSSGGR